MYYCLNNTKKFTVSNQSLDLYEFFTCYTNALKAHVKQLETYEATPSLLLSDETNDASKTKPKVPLYYVCGRNIPIEEVTLLAKKPMSDDLKRVIENRIEYSRQITEFVMKPNCRVSFFLIVY
jgi:hypothetical protein